MWSQFGNEFDNRLQDKCHSSNLSFVVWIEIDVEDLSVRRIWLYKNDYVGGFLSRQSDTPHGIQFVIIISIQ